MAETTDQITTPTTPKVVDRPERPLPVPTEGMRLDPSLMMLLPSGDKPGIVSIQPGEQTSEYILAMLVNQRAHILFILGIAVFLASAVVDIAGWFPASHRTLQILQLCGVVKVVVGKISQTLITMKYIQGRSDIKVAASK